MAESLPPKMLKIATFINNHTYERNSLIMNYDGTPMQPVFQAPMIRLLAKGLGVTFNIVIPEDNTFGVLKPDGKSTGLKGMIERGEADLSVCGFTMHQQILEAFPFTYPLLVSDATFMTNKLEPRPRSFAVVEVFSFETWLYIGLCLILMSLCLYFLLNRREKFSTILLENIGCLFEQSLSFAARQRSTALLLLCWFIGVSILSFSYKAVILSIPTAPRMDGIRDLSALSKALNQNSIKCFSWGKGFPGVKSFINNCVNESSFEGLYGIKAFHNYPYKKVFFGERIEINKYHRFYHVSDDSIGLSFIGIPYSKKFCCPKKLESVVHRIVASGMYEKFLLDQDFAAQLQLPKDVEITDDKAGTSPLTIEDLTGAFFVLFVGHLCSFFVLIAEILYKKWR